MIHETVIPKPEIPPRKNELGSYVRIGFALAALGMVVYALRDQISGRWSDITGVGSTDTLALECNALNNLLVDKDSSGQMYQCVGGQWQLVEPARRVSPGPIHPGFHKKISTNVGAVGIYAEAKIGPFYTDNWNARVEVAVGNANVTGKLWDNQERKLGGKLLIRNFSGKYIVETGQ